MYTAEKIQEIHRERAQAVFDRFEQEPSDNLQKSETEVEQEELFWTPTSLRQYKEDLMKGIDSGEIGEDGIQKAQQELKSLVKSTRSINGKEVEVYVKK